MLFFFVSILHQIIFKNIDMTTIQNPVLKGFNPDPSICRVGNDYYIATSTFEWYPGVQIHHSTDLANWTLASRPLTRLSQLDMRGNPDSCGVWAPCLTHSDGKFYLIYTDTKSYQGDHKVCHNYLVTATDIDGPWSEPVYLNSSGFDPSLFHDDDGRKWLVNAQWDHRPEVSRSDKRPAKCFSGILLQEYSEAEQKLVGPIHNIYKGTSAGLVEGPHLYKRDGYYYLLTAEGGTFYAHTAGFARSKTIDGMYEGDPEGNFLTSWGYQQTSIRRAGHSCMTDTPTGELVLAHLCGRPLAHRGRSVLGRETALQKLVTNADGWPRLSTGKVYPEETVTFDGDAVQNLDLIDEYDDFSGTELRDVYQTLRQPIKEDVINLKDNPGQLKITGKEFICSLYEQALIARRQEHINYTATTALEFNPEKFQQMAGIASYYNTQKFIYLYVTANDDGQPELEVMMANMDGGSLSYPLGGGIPLPANQTIQLKINVQSDQWRAAYAATDATGDDIEWTDLGLVLDASILSDEFGGEHFTGAFVALCCQDASGANKEALFNHFSYKEYDVDAE